MRVKVFSLIGDAALKEYGIGNNNMVFEFEEEEKDKDIELFMWRLTKKPNLEHLAWLALKIGRGYPILSKVIKEEQIIID